MTASPSIYAVALTAALALGGCGGQADPETPPQPEARVTWQLFDCSGFRRFAHQYVQDLVTVAKSVAEQDPPGKLHFACVDGRPLTNAVIKTRDFRTATAGVPVDEDVAAQARQAQASGLGRSYAGWIRKGRTNTGSGLLQALTYPARQPGVKRVYYWTDGEVRDHDSGFNLPTASAQRMRAEVARWKKPLAGLRGVELVLIGGGRGAQNQSTAEKSRVLFGDLARSVRAKLIWTPTLQQTDLD